jgi:hypothetical protein
MVVSNLLRKLLRMYKTPPNEVWVHTKEYGRAKAVYGREGTLPHWETESGLHLEPRAITEWEEIDAIQSSEKR